MAPLQQTLSERERPPYEPRSVPSVPIPRSNNHAIALAAAVAAAGANATSFTSSNNNSASTSPSISVSHSSSNSINSAGNVIGFGSGNSNSNGIGNSYSEDDVRDNTHTTIPIATTLRPLVLERPVNRSAHHSRESSIEKLAGIPESPSGSPVSVKSPRILPTPTSSRTGFSAVNERLADLKATAAYGHHRQTSIVHGIQHSRNGSVASSSSSPLSPQLIAAAGAAFFSDRSTEAQLLLGRMEQDPLPPPLSSSSSMAASRPPTAMSGTTAVSSVHPGLERIDTNASNVTITQRKLERMQSSKTRKDHSHHHTHSSKHHNDQKTVGEYALHVLFTHFIALAEEKLNECITVPFDPEPPVEQICGPGADPAFDQFIVALGHIASQKPKPLIDSIMLWRKHKSEIANELRGELAQLRGNAALVPVPTGTSLLRRNTEPIQGVQGTGSSEDGQSLVSKQECLAQAERRSNVSIYILCRVLLEVISKSSLSSITPEMEDKLESIIFGQLKLASIDQLFVSSLKLANWNLFAQILGVMSEINFVGVTERFILDLDRSFQDLSARSPTSPSRDPEGQMELVLGGMKHLRMRIEPEEAWDKSCDFLISLGRLFTRSHGQKVKSAFCQVLDTLLLPIASRASNNHFTNPKWAEVISSISPRLAQMFVKPRHWLLAFPLTATMVCVSPPETSSSQWLQLILPLQPRLKDRAMRPICLQVISRLLWTYLYRCNDTPSSVIRKLDEVMKLVLPSNKRNYTVADTAANGPLLHVMRVIGFAHPEYCFKHIIFPLINAELFATNKELKVEHLEPERMVIGIRAFLAIMADLEHGDQGPPPFLYDFSSSLATERPSISSPPAGSQSSLATMISSATHTVEAISCKPVRLAALSEASREYYKKFSVVLGKITIFCDNAFGGQAVLDEKFNSPGPKTPIADTFNFARRDDHVNPADQKQACYELLQVAVQALPRCLPTEIPIQSLINLLCTGTAHVQNIVAAPSAESLKALAKQSYAHQVTTGFARFIFNFDDRYSTMSDGGMLGPGHIESTLKLYVELLQFWRDEIERKSKDATSESGENSEADKRAMKLDLSSLWSEVEQVEARGLFFLCSQSRRVRYYAVTVLRLIKEFHAALGQDIQQVQDTERLVDILENDSVQVMSLNDENLSVAERSRLQRGMQTSNSKGALIDLCTSDVSYDTTLWFKIFPNLIRVAHDRCPFTVTIARDLVCNRIMQMYRAIVVLSEPTRGLYYGSNPESARTSGMTPTTQPDVLVEQWKLYLAFACTTLVDAGAPQPVSANQHVRKGSRPTERIITARVLFKFLIPLLAVSSASVREAVVLAMGSINKNIYRALLEELAGQVSRCNDEARARLHQRTNSSSRRNRKIDLLRTELTHVYKLTTHFLKDPEIYEDEWIVNNLCVYAKDLKLFLMDGEVQMDWEFQRLRRHYCGLVQELFEGISRTKDPSRWMTFESRKSSFALMEDWCGFSPNTSQIRQREDTMRQSLLDQQPIGERGTATAAMEIEKRNLRSAALSTMAALCAGPLSVTTESAVVLQFDIRRMLAWVDSIYSSGSDRLNNVGRQALKNLIICNQEYSYLLEHCIARCYLADAPKVQESYFSVVTEVLLELPDYPLPFWKTLSLCLFTLGNDSSDIRLNSAKVLRALDDQQQMPRSSKLRDFDISISDKTKAVYKLAQFEISKRLAIKHPELAFHVFSEFTYFYKNLQPSDQRNVVAVMLPWIQTIELKVDPNGGPIANSYVLLANLLEITIKSSAALHNEVQALWQALATGPHLGNVRLVMDFVISLCLERREQNFVEYAKQITVFLASSPSTPGLRVVEFLLKQITPKGMVPNEKKDVLPPPPDVNQLPYCADLSDALPVGTKQAGFSLGQLALILLVDLMVSPAQLPGENLPVLLQVVVVLWDHYTPLVQEQAREMLVHLIHELVISKMDDATSAETKKAVEILIESIRRHDRSVVWSYEDNNGKSYDTQKVKVPQGMEKLVAEVVKTFEVTFPGIREQWGRLSLAWATTCPVRHLACRSFQIFRCVLTCVDPMMLGDMLARLSNTIADDDTEIQTFSMEILMTLKTLIAKLDREQLQSLPQLFWTVCACLESVNEREFLEALEMLNEYLERLDFHDPAVRQTLSDGQPTRWDGPFEGLQPLIYKGLRSSVCIEPTLKTIDRLVVLPSGSLIGNDNRLFFALVANFPRFLDVVDQGWSSVGEEVLHTAEIFFAVAEAQGFNSICVVLERFMDSGYQKNNDFIIQLFHAFREQFLPQLDFPMLTMLMGFLTNSISSVKIMAMHILSVVIPETDMRRSEIAGHGSDLVSPLLRLLQSDLCMEALKVLDNIMTMSGSSMDKQHLRMSMTRSSSNTVRKEYERTQSLFGIPDESGWAVPMPAKMMEIARANIHAAFYMCQSNVEDGLLPNSAATPEIEFHSDDFPYGYFQMLPDRSNTMMSDDPRGDSRGGADLVTKLDSLDDFFDDMSLSPRSESRSSRTVTEFSPENFESTTQLYDEQILPILHQAASNTSFQNGFVDRPTPAANPRDGPSNAMNPGAFSINNTHLARPAQHNRSITSPSASAGYYPQIGDFMSDDELTEDVFSDGDDDRPSAQGDSSFFLENMIRPMKQATRRLTGGRARDAERQRDLFRTQISPQVPKVPDTFLHAKATSSGDAGMV